MMEVLNVAGDNRAAKTIANYLSNGSSREREGLSAKNKIYEFKARVEGQQSKMIMTSVSELHLLNYMFRYNKWSDDKRNLLSLVDTASIDKVCDTRFTEIKRTLEREVKTCQVLIIWTYCDTEGENMGFEVTEICRTKKPNIKIHRAKFSTMTAQSVRRALDNLGTPNKALSDVVDVRRQLDLRIGVAFTRFQRMRLESKFRAMNLGKNINYGCCLLPTLGFVVERFLEIERFNPKSFRTIKVMDVRDGSSVEFRWDENQFFDELPCQIFFDKYCESPDATVEKVTCECKIKSRPMPLNTVELVKHCLDVFNFTAKQTMDVALDLYNQGVISYPQTETNQFPDDLDLEPLVKRLLASPEWELFAQEVLNNGISPRQGIKNDGAHAPIYPTENIVTTLKGDEAKVYEFIVRRFLACISKDAEVEETTVKLNICDKQFEASGLRITAKNYLDVYPYENWKDIKIHEYEEGQTFRPKIETVNGTTSPPNLLTESDLITLMEEHQIGNDSTYAEHIESIKLKDQVRLINQKYLKPTKLGLAMVMGYDSMELGYKMSKPDLRKKLNDDLRLICNGVKLPEIVLRDQQAIYRAILSKIFEQCALFDATVARYLNRRE